MLNQRAKEYEVAQDKAFAKSLNKILGEEWIKEFDTKTFKWKSDKKSDGGISVNTMRLLELMSSVQGSKDKLGEKAQKKVSEALLNIMSQASSLSYDGTSEF